MKKRILYLAIPALFASLTLSACNEDPTQQNNNNNPTVEKYSFTFELDAPEAIKDDIKYTLSNGNGEYDKGTKIAINISSYDSVNYSFDGYFVNNSKVTTETSYTVDLQSDTTLVAKFSAKGEEEKPDPTPDPDPDPTPEPDNPSFDEVEIGEVVETGKNLAYGNKQMAKQFILMAKWTKRIPSILVQQLILLLLQISKL